MNPGEAQRADYHAALLRAANIVREESELALACHVTPDGDALGSMLGFHHLAAANGRRCVSSWPAPFVAAPHYRSVPGLDLAIEPSRYPPSPDVMLTFDCGSLGRLKELGLPARKACDSGELIVIDHHASNDRYGTVNLIDTKAAATAVVVRELARVLGWELNREAAWCLYVGLVTDTGRFQYESTTTAVFALAEELSAFDLPVARLSRELFEEHRFNYLKLAARALARAELDAEHGLVSTWVPQSDQVELDVCYEEIEGLIDWIRTTSEAEVACVCKQAADGMRVSLRSLDKVDVGAIATALGGGGHRLAAGFTMNASVAEVIAAIKALLPTP